MSKWDTESAEWYANKYGEYATNKLGVEALSLDVNSTIVDIGCGTGCALRHASDKVTHGSLVGIDPVPRMIQIAREQTAGHSAVDRITYYEGSAESIPVNDDFADFVLAFDSYDHWQDRAKGLEEVLRVLKPTGHFVVVKDGGLPSGALAKKRFLATIVDAGFSVLDETNTEKEDVMFTQWLCAVERK